MQVLYTISLYHDDLEQVLTVILKQFISLGQEDIWDYNLSCLCTQKKIQDISVAKTADSCSDS